MKAVLFVLVIALLMSGVASAAWFDNYDYRTPIEIDGNTEDLTDYQVNVTLQGTNPLSANYLDFDMVLTGGSDIRFTDSDQTTKLDCWIEDWNDTAMTATIWIKVPSVTQAGTKTVYMYYGRRSNDIKLSVDSTIHEDYGLAYPVTYEFSIPSSSSNLKTYKRYTTGQAWSQITEKTGNDFFNGIEAVRFDYSNDTAYVSVAFDDVSDEIHLKIVDVSDQDVNVSYNGITQYYDDRDAAVTSTFDDWAYDIQSETNFTILQTILNDAKIWHTVGIVTNLHGAGPPDWNSIQSAIDAGYTEAGTHTRTHPAVPYDDYDSEIGGAKADVIGNLTLPYSKGSKEYLYGFIEPFCNSDANSRAKLGEYKYLSDRNCESYRMGFGTWDSINKLYNRYDTTARCDYCPAQGLYPTSDGLNASFDKAVHDGGIYHFWGHPGSIWDAGTCSINFSDGAYFKVHINYIKEKKNLWYVGFGSLYAYHYVKDRDIVDVSIGRGTDNAVFELFNDFDNEKTGNVPVKWVCYHYSDMDLPNINISDQIYYGDSGKSVNLYSYPGNTTYMGGAVNITNHIIEFKVRSYDNSTIGTLFNGKCDSTNAVYIEFASDGDIKYHDTTYHILQAYNDNTWYAFKLVINSTSDTYDIYINDVLKKGNAPFRNNVANINAISFEAWVALTDNYVDDVIVRKYTSTEPTLITTAAFRGYDKIFTGLTNTISPTDYISYSAEPNISNIANMTITPTAVLAINVTTFSEPLKEYNESAASDTYAMFTVGECNADTTYIVNIYADANGSKMQTFYVTSNGTGYITYNATGYGYDRWVEIAPAGDTSTYATHLTATTPGTAANTITTTDTCGNASFGAATLTGGSDSDSEWAGSDVPTGVDIWRDGAGMIAIVVLALLAGIVIVCLRGGGIGEGLTISPNAAIGLAVGLLVLLAVFSIAPIFGDKIDSVADLGQETYATGRLTFVLDGTTADGETVTIDATTLEFDRSADGVTAGRIAVNISDSTAATASQNLTAAINGNATLAAVVAARRDVSS